MFHYQFPKINHIDDVKWAIADCDEIIIAERDHFDVINYIVATDTTFPEVSGALQRDMTKAALRRECRGLIFDKHGNLISRPFQKFFNVNEREETQTQHIDFTKPHRILEKLDGSMIRPLRIGNDWRLGTKMGITDVAMQAEAYIADKPHFVKFFDFCEKLGENGVTPIFEWLSRQQRIVIDYQVDELVLLAVRDNLTGEYYVYEMLEKISREFDIGIVRQFPGNMQSMQELIDYTRNQEGIEGFIVKFDDGMMVKIKGDWYVQIHKAKDQIGREKNLIAMLLDNNVDDVKPFLLQDDLDRLDKFEHEFFAGIHNTVHELVEAYNENHRSNRGEFARLIHETLPSNWFPIMFKMYDGVNCVEALIDTIRKNLTTQKKVDSVRWIFNTSWNYGSEE